MAATVEVPEYEVHDDVELDPADTADCDERLGQSLQPVTSHDHHICHAPVA